MKSMTDYEEDCLTVPHGNGSKVNCREHRQMMSVHEVCTAFGVTRKRLYFYDKIDLLKPAARQGKQQEKMYTDHSAERLRQILIYQDAGLTLREIKMLMNDEAADADAIFLRAKNRLSANRNRIEIQMQKLDELIRKNREGKEE